MSLLRTRAGQVAANQARGTNTSAAAGGGDIVVKGTTATNSRDIAVTGDGCGTMYLGPFGDRIIVAQNIADTALPVDATNAPTNVEQVGNFVGGSWVA